MSMDYASAEQKLLELVEKVKDSNPTAPTDFRAYLETLKDVPPFTAETRWDRKWRDSVYKFGQLFSDSKSDPTPYFNILKELHWEDNEVLGFFHSELVWNFWNQDSAFIKDEFSHLVKKFPGNPEFHHDYGHYLLAKGDYEQAILSYRRAIRLESAQVFVGALFLAWSKYFAALVEKNKLEKAGVVASEMKIFFNQVGFESYWPLKNNILAMEERVLDHKLISSRIEGLNDLIDRRVEGLRSHLINIVALFTSVIGYILIGANLVLSTREIKESFLMMFGLGLVMIIFVLSVNYLFKGQGKEGFWGFLHHRQFWAILILTAILLLTYFLL